MQLRKQVLRILMQQVPLIENQPELSIAFSMYVESLLLFSNMLLR